jgi:hypothetical protein
VRAFLLCARFLGPEFVRFRYQLFVKGRCMEIYTFSKNFHRALLSSKASSNMSPFGSPAFHCFGISNGQSVVSGYLFISMFAILKRVLQSAI